MKTLPPPAPKTNYLIGDSNTMSLPIVLGEGLTLSLGGFDYPVVLLASQYQMGDALALYFISEDLGEPVAKASVFVDELSNALDPGEFVCKNYSENQGMAQWLIDSGIAIDTGRAVRTGKTISPILRLNNELSKKYMEAVQDAPLH